MSRKALIAVTSITCLCLYLLLKSSKPKIQYYNWPISVDDLNKIGALIKRGATPEPQTKLTDSLHRKTPAPSVPSGTPILIG